ncbi:telomere-associated protein RIF1 [Diachasmimorpha longicaudata]|uniref:telomere-associated protein RIF1 n=1 Tax=Diachasmimorpha longicaudata TaxID=58733 RepID=UPI0030B9145D
MSVTAAVVNKFLKTLRESNSIAEKWTALTCITSHAGKGLSQTLTKAQFTELCTQLISMITSCDAKIQSDITKLFNIILKEFINMDPVLFGLATKIDRSKRLAFFDFLKTVEVPALTHLLKDEDVVLFFEDCLKGINVESMNWLAKDPTPGNIEILRKVEAGQLDPKDDVEHRLILKVVEFLQKVYDCAAETATINVSQFHTIILEKIATLAYMGYSKQRDPALKLLETAVSQGLVPYTREKHPSSWQAFKTNLSDVFSPRMTLLVSYKYAIWSSLWSLTIRMLGTEAHKNSALINELLLVEEKAFKSSETEVRKQAFLCWKYLIDNFALNPEEFNIWKRVKLLCIPLNAKNSKIEVIALTKLEVWWHLIVTMVTKKTTDHVAQVTIQFLNFCFGPLGDTPLLSKKQNLVASPGKIFFKTKICAIDALLQMMVIKEKDRSLITSVLLERLPTAIPVKMFEEHHKAFLHSVSEAVIMMSNLTNDDLKNRHTLNTILFTNLMDYIGRSNPDKKPNIYKELILVTNEMISHSDDSSMITDLILYYVLPALTKVSDQLVYPDNTLIDLLKKIVTPSILARVQASHLNDIRELIERTMMLSINMMYHPNVLGFIKSLLDGMSAALVKKVQQSLIIDIWRILADAMTRYMGDDQPINEGTDLSHNLTTLETLVNFPFKGDITYTKSQVNTVSVYWRHLYKAFDQQADRIPSVKHNLILNATAKVMVEALSRSENYFHLVARCLTPLMETINYERLPLTGQVPALVYVLRDVLMLSLKNNSNEEAELALKSMDAYLISVFGLNNGPRILLYLEGLRPAIELLLRDDLIVGIEREVLNALEHIIFIIDKSAEALTVKFVGSFKQIILLARRHTDPSISLSVRKLLEANPHVKDDVRYLFSMIEHEVQNPSTNHPEILPFENKIAKSGKVVGSFLGKVIEPSKTFKPPEAKKDLKKRTPLPPDPDSQDYVVIKSDPMFDVNRLTEHQKECLKRRREDLAIFNDTSQSGSTDTHDLQQWFDQSRQRNESNKENTMTVEEDPSSSKQDEPKSVPIESESEDVQADKAPVVDVSPVETEVMMEASGSGVSQEIIKKLDFESREEFPESNDGERKEKPCSLGVFSSAKSRRGRGTRGRRTYLEGYDTMDRHLKRKANYDEDPDKSEKKRTKRPDDYDSEVINTTESQPEPQLPRTQDPPGIEKLSDHARREISRLKIDMVADFVFPTVGGRRRSKQKGEDPDDPRPRALRSAEREIDNEQSQELLKKKRRRSARMEPDALKKDSRDQKLNSGTDSDDKSSEFHLDEDDSSKVSGKPSDMFSTDKPTDISDHDEVVESSQEPTLLRSPKRLQTRAEASSPSTAKTVTKTPVSTSPKKQVSNDPEETFMEEDKILGKTPTEDPKKAPEDCSKSPGLASFTTSVLASSSPQGNPRRLFKIRNRQGMSPHGRGAHMLGLISGAPLATEKSEEDVRKEQEPLLKMRPVILRHSEKVSSPSGSRQEKIFNNMKGNDFSQSPFSTLKNDGEKVSPRRDRPPELTTLDHDYAETKEMSTTIGSERELPILEWSSANPPSLTASPGTSILKRHKSLPLDSDQDITPKRKRVSFADPPVFKEMWYVPSTFKSPKAGGLRSTSRRDSPLKPKPRPRVTVTLVDPLEMEALERLNEVDLQREKDNEMLAKIADDLEEDDDVNFDSDEESEEKEVREDPPSLEVIKNDEVIDTISPETLRESQGENETANSFKDLEKPRLNITDDSILGKILTEGHEAKSQELEETLDIQNLSSFNSTANSDELCVASVPRTSTQIAVMTAAADADTLPITDSMFLSQTMSQCSQGSQNSIDIPVLEQLNSISPIYHGLMSCEEPLKTIITDLTNPLWVPHLSNWFEARGLKTIGDLARMTEKEVADIPTKGNPKAAYVKEILEKFSKTWIPTSLEQSLQSSNDKPREGELVEIVEETIEVHPGGDDEDTMSATSEDITPPSISINSLDNSKGHLEIDSVQTQEANDSMIINTTISPPAKSSGMLSPQESISISVVESQDVESSQIPANEPELEEVLMQEAENQATDSARAALSVIGFDEALSKLEERYGKEKEFISKILTSYKGKIRAKDVKEILDIEIVKQVIKEKCSTTEICEVISEVIGDGEKKGGLVEVLKGLPRDLVRQALTDGEAVSSSVILDVALERNSAQAVADAVGAKFPEVAGRIFEETVNQYNSPSELSGSKKMSREELRRVFGTVAEQMDEEDLLEASYEAMRKKIKK